MRNKIGCIEGKPAVGKIPVDRDATGQYYAEKIKGNQNEDSTIYEGVVTYDIQFDALLPHTDTEAHLIINLETQGVFKPSDKQGGAYHLVTRGIYYCARMLAAQKEHEFTGSQYDKLAKVYSIWICLNPPEEWRGAINPYRLEEFNLFGEQHEVKEKYDKLCVILLCLGENDKIPQSDVVDLLNTIVSNELSKEEKEKQLKEKHNLTITKDLEGRLSDMCDYGDYVWDKGVQKGRAEGAEGSLLASIRNLMKNANVTADRAMEMLGISTADRSKYKAKLSS